jgi:three-Cys-motif partner protein
MARRKRLSSDESQESLFSPSELPVAKSFRQNLRQLERPLWTEAKALLIARYLYYFVQITKHGTYIDGFAGPQRPERRDMWAAKLVLESEPRWLRHFFLCDSAPSQVEQLRTLVAEQPDEPRRKIVILEGDFNEQVQSVLASGVLTDREAAFCLLDQRTFECRWRTLHTLAAHKATHKIELFYFLPVGWLNRSIEATKNVDNLREWWGKDDIEALRGADQWEQGRMAATRMTEELGYTYATPWPIFKERHSGRLMYFMVHASDHPEAPKLMQRAYANALKPPESMEDLQMEFGLLVEATGK